MNLSDAFPSRYMKAGVDVDEDGQRVVTIEDVTMERVGQGADARDKLVVAFQETDKTLVLNKTNATTISKLYGDETDAWPGKRITLYCTYVQFQADMVLSIRVRPKVPTVSGKATNQPTTGPGKAVPMGATTGKAPANMAAEIDPDDPNAPPF